ncbi:SDR family NAD(P)-dependent oxidoreductase [Aquimarina brevivitae]|uniref:Short-subunit dehydrogenase n=1 Tax=Aquimarina brevivitae TaxID=323412 RepID=A0A4Q7NZW2_9FLAO|nr:SDR family oxidoreductase [Aquimarina brevivitae]RZS92558.1 hypothetical protein EV197_2696 [Aquimarina brevivitae]
MNTALITGASSGIGLELAIVFARHNINLVLVARSEEKLQKIKATLESEYPIAVFLIIKDLTKPDAAKEVFETTTSNEITVDYLVNNAGFGDFGKFSENDWEKEKAMIDLNIIALTQLTKLYLPSMLSHNNGKILNVASVAAFMPGPLMAIYYATKAFVLHFSEAIANELNDTNITVTALCPGATKSSFSEVANMKDSKLFKSSNLPSSKTVAEYGYKAMMKGKTVAVHGWKNKLLLFTTRFIPRTIVTKLTRLIQSK